MDVLAELVPLQLVGPALPSTSTQRVVPDALAGVATSASAMDARTGIAANRGGTWDRDTCRTSGAGGKWPRRGQFDHIGPGRSIGPGTTKVMSAAVG